MTYSVYTCSFNKDTIKIAKCRKNMSLEEATGFKTNRSKNANKICNYVIVEESETAEAKLNAWIAESTAKWEKATHDYRTEKNNRINFANKQIQQGRVYTGDICKFISKF